VKSVEFFSLDPILISIRDRSTRLFLSASSSPCEIFPFRPTYSESARSSRGFVRESIDISSNTLARERKTLWRLSRYPYFPCCCYSLDVPLTVREKYSSRVSQEFINSIKTYSSSIGTCFCREQSRARMKASRYRPRISSHVATTGEGSSRL